MANEGKKTLAAFALGAAAGAVLGILFAPKKGKETREDVSKWLKEKREAGAETLAELREKGGDIVAGIRERFPAQQKNVSATKIGRDALRSDMKETVGV